MLLQSTGVEFPEVTTFWDGDKMRSVGAGVRAKKFAFMPVKVRLLGMAQSGKESNCGSCNVCQEVEIRRGESAEALSERPVTTPWGLRESGHGVEHSQYIEGADGNLRGGECQRVSLCALACAQQEV